MSELKGQILGVILTLVLFGSVSAVLTASINNLNSKVKEEVKETTGKEVVVEGEFANLLHY